MKLPFSYYRSEDVTGIALDLLGKVLCTRINNVFSSGIISETEAYAGVTDRASHAFGGRRTGRTETMYRAGGCAYVYLCYGVHHLFNVVTGPEDVPHAILVRGITPLEGIPTIAERLGKQSPSSAHTNGPGKLSKALGITTRLDGNSLRGEEIWIEDRKTDLTGFRVEVSNRIGVQYAGEDAFLPYRFNLVKA